jgi:hypothetical protein
LWPFVTAIKPQETTDAIAEFFQRFDLNDTDKIFTISFFVALEIEFDSWTGKNTMTFRGEIFYNLLQQNCTHNK